MRGLPVDPEVNCRNARASGSNLTGSIFSTLPPFQLPGVRRNIKFRAAGVQRII